MTKTNNGRVYRMTSLDVMLFLDRKELEFIKEEVKLALENDYNGAYDKDWIIKLAAKLIEACEREDNTQKAIQATQSL